MLLPAWLESSSHLHFFYHWMNWLNPVQKSTKDLPLSCQNGKKTKKLQLARLDDSSEVLLGQNWTMLSKVVPTIGL